MTKSPFAQKLDEIVRSVSSELKAVGFRKKGRTFNRIAEDGLVHVIGFQMGQFPVGNLETYVVPGLRENLYGKYTVNLGVHIREVYELSSSVSAELSAKRFPNARGRAGAPAVTAAAPTFCQDYHCELRARLGQLASPPSDIWWSLDADSSGEDMASLLRDSLEAWFPLFAARDQILGVDVSQGRPLGWPIRGGMVQAIMWSHRGDRERSRATLQRYWSENQATGVNPGHADYIREIASRLGIKIDAA